MSDHPPIPDQIKILRMLHAEAVAEERGDVALSLGATIYLLRWIEANGETFKLAHKVVSDKAVREVCKAFPEAIISGIRV